MREMFTLPFVQTISVPMSYLSSLTGFHPYREVGSETFACFRRYNSGPKKQRTAQDIAEWPLFRELKDIHGEFYELYCNSPKVKHLEKRGQAILRE